MEKTKKLKLRIAGKTLLQLKLKSIPRRYTPIQGEVDIVVEAAKNAIFEKAAIQTQRGTSFVHAPVNYVSWHGFYDFKGIEIRLPVIRFHHDREVLKEVRHKGTINQKNIFFFPICSVYIPASFPLEKISQSGLEKGTMEIVLREHSNVRIDFFVLPKGISSEDFFANFTISAFYLSADITVFDKSRNGELCGLPVSKPEDSVYLNFNIGGWAILARVLYTNLTREPELCNTYSILFHDPNNAIEMLLNRRFSPHTFDGEVQEGALKMVNDLHGAESRMFAKSGRAQ